MGGPPTRDVSLQESWPAVSPAHADAAPLVLLVEDDADNRKMYATALSAAGFTTIEAADAEHALLRAAAVRPAVVVTEFRLGAGLDGLELCERLKANESTRQIPVIVLTGWGHYRFKTRAASAGCTAVYVKPVTPDDLVAVVVQALREETRPTV
jgi:CheY-like chemotaxis protein